MAPRMIPHYENPDVQIQGDGQTGERELYRALKQCLPDSWTVLYNLKFRIGRDDSQIDFLVVVPDKGIINLECKGFGYSYKEGSFYLREAGIEKRVSSPFDRGDRAIHNMHDYFSKLIGYEKIGAYCYMVVFACDDFFKGKIPGGNPYITKSDLPKIKDHIESALANYSQTFHEFHSNIERQVVEHWAQEIQSQPRPDITLDIQQSEETLEGILRFSYSQEIVCRKVKNSQFTLVNGGPGTGKTLIALHIAREYASAGKRVLYVCFNSLLASHLKQNCGDITNLTICNFHKLDTKLCEKNLKERGLGASGIDWEATDKAFHEKIKLAVRDKFDVILVDEAQDFYYSRPDGTCDRTRLRVIANILRDDGKAAFFQDVNQAIFSKSPHNQEFPAGVFGNVDVVSLDVNLRSTQKIHQFCECVQPTSTQAQNVVIGTVPVIFSSDVASAVITALNAGFKPNHIAILSQELSVLDNIKSVMFNSKQVNVYGKAAVDDEKAEQNFKGWKAGKHIWKSTVQSFKGLEAACVILLDAAATSPTNLYVACSRAKYALYVIPHTGDDAQRFKSFVDKL